MRTNFRYGTFLSATALLWAGCERASFRFSYYDDHPVHVSHVCSEHCYDHCYDGGRVVVIRGHRHGHDCGHFWDGRHWVIVRAGLHPHHGAHVCSPSCHHHYYDGARLVVLDGHRHRPGCGHEWDGRFWVRIGKAPARSHGHAYTKGGPRKDREAAPPSAGRERSERGKSRADDSRPRGQDRSRDRDDASGTMKSKSGKSKSKKDDR